MDIQKLKYDLDLYNAELSLYACFEQAWPHIEGGTQFVPNWHLEAMSMHLEAVVTRQIRTLIINLPPRCGKSTLSDVVFPAWVWMRDVYERFLFASHKMTLAIRDSLKCRRLIQSQWYQERWGSRYKLVGDQNTKGKFENNYGGFRMTTSVGAGTTGEGGSINICDDPNDARDGDSDVKLESRIDWIDQVWSTRLNNAARDCRIYIQQRISENDVTGHLLRKFEELQTRDGVVHLVFPMEHEVERRCRTVVLPGTNGKIWEDPRTEEGELLWPARFDAATVRNLKNGLGSEYLISGQFQQRPSPGEGGIFKRNWWAWWKDRTPPRIEYIIQSWDTAYSQNKNASYSCCTTWGVFYDEHDIEHIMLLSLWRGRVDYVELRERAKRLYHDYRDTGVEPSDVYTGKEIDEFVIEAKATGDPLIHDLRLAGIMASPFTPMRDFDKKKRAHFVTSLVSTGRVWLPTMGEGKFLRADADLLVDCAACFPTGESNDVVDSMTQALIKLKTGLLLRTKNDMEFIQSKYPFEFEHEPEGTYY